MRLCARTLRLFHVHGRNIVKHIYNPKSLNPLGGQTHNIIAKMSRIGSWIRGSAKPTTSQASESQSAEDERQNLAEAMSAATLIMNDDVDEADRQLMLKDSAFHLLGRGL